MYLCVHASCVSGSQYSNSTFFGQFYYSRIDTGRDDKEGHETRLGLFGPNIKTIS